jgi:hypothetical protein
MTLRFLFVKLLAEKSYEICNRNLSARSFIASEAVTGALTFLTTMRQGWCNSWLAFVLLILAGVAAPVPVSNARAEESRISLIEPFVNNQMLIHFDTEANRTYILQYTSSLSATSHWVSIATSLVGNPFPDHYIIVDTRSAAQRFYRLSVTP